MICLVILIFTALFLSVAVEKRFSFSKSSFPTQPQTIALETEAAMLRGEITRVKNQLRQSGNRTASDGCHLSELLPELTRLQAEVSRHRKRKQALSASVAELATSFSAYREQFRFHAWRSASGEKLGNLITKTGRRYDDVVIRSVSPRGMLIFHSSGVARLPAEELPHEFQQRFLWEQEPAPAPVTERQPVLPGTLTEKSASVPVSTAPAQSRPDPSNPELVTTKANDLVQARALLSRIQAEHQHALAQERASRKRAAPEGSRSWTMRSQSLCDRLQHAVVGEAVAREQLFFLAPQHPLLNQRR